MRHLFAFPFPGRRALGRVQVGAVRSNAAPSVRGQLSAWTYVCVSLQRSFHCRVWGVSRPLHTAGKREPVCHPQVGPQPLLQPGTLLGSGHPDPPQPEPLLSGSREPGALGLPAGRQPQALLATWVSGPSLREELHFWHECQMGVKGRLDGLL